MDHAALLERLTGVQSAGANQWNAKCPAHDDREASLSVGVGRDRVLLHCHAGCGVGAVMHALGLDWRDIFLDVEDPSGAIRIPPAPPAPAPTSRQRDDMAGLPTAAIVDSWTAQQDVVAERLLEVKGWSAGTLRAFEVGWDGARVTLPVRDAEGALLNVLRYLPGGSPKMLALKGRGRHLFPVTRLYPAGKALWLVEGEPDAITAHELGIPAVAVPGVSTWREDWVDRFAGRRVTVCMDCDEQGRACARERVDQFRRAGVEARAVDLDPSRSDGFDLGDALVAARAEDRVEDLRKYLARLWYEAWAA